MEKIEHSQLDIRGLSLHVAHTGEGESGTVVFLHGFPEIWYSWRYQMVAVAKAGFRAIAPDFRGYGLSEQPPEPKNASCEDLVADLFAIFDALSISKAFVVAKYFGAMPAYDFALRHPDRVSGVITLGIHFMPLSALGDLPKDAYIPRWRVKWTAPVAGPNPATSSQPISDLTKKEPIFDLVMIDRSPADPNPSKRDQRPPTRSPMRSATSDGMAISRRDVGDDEPASRAFWS